jgi:hypothetical protein
VPNEDASLVTVSCRAEYTTTLDVNGNAVDTIGFPAVGVVQWGVGGGINELEFDIPSAKFPGYIPPYGSPGMFQPLSLNANGVQFTISASHVSVYIRHDGGLTPILANGADIIGDLRPIRVSCFVGPGGTASENMPLRRSFYAVGGTGAVYYPLVFPANITLAPGAFVTVPVPPFAKSMAFYRVGVGLTTPPLEVWCSPNANLALGNPIINIPVGNNDFFPLDPITGTLVVFNRGATDINYLRVSFDVTPM